MNYSEFNINQKPLVIKCIECGMPSNNHNAYHMFNSGTSINNYQIKVKCVCVPSGKCHSNSLLGCPHKHYFNDKNIWSCMTRLN